MTTIQIRQCGWSLHNVFKDRKNRDRQRSQTIAAKGHRKTKSVKINALAVRMKKIKRFKDSEYTEEDDDRQMLRVGKEKRTMEAGVQSSCRDDWLDNGVELVILKGKPGQYKDDDTSFGIAEGLVKSSLHYYLPYG